MSSRKAKKDDWEHPVGRPRKKPAEAPANGLVDWKRRSEAGEVCGIVGCEPPKKTLVLCSMGCLNHYCPDHLAIHAHVVSADGKVNPGPRVRGNKIVTDQNDTSAPLAMCPRCKRITETTSTKAGPVLQTHDIAPMCRQVCNGSGEAVSLEGSSLAAAEVTRLSKWLRSIAFTPHLGCDKVPTNTAEVVEQVEKSEGLHGKGENPNCGACKAQAALSGRPAP